MQSYSGGHANSRGTKFPAGTAPSLGVPSDSSHAAAAGQGDLSVTLGFLDSRLPLIDVWTGILCNSWRRPVQLGEGFDPDGQILIWETGVELSSSSCSRNCSEAQYFLQLAWRSSTCPVDASCPAAGCALWWCGWNCLVQSHPFTPCFLVPMFSNCGKIHTEHVLPSQPYLIQSPMVWCGFLLPCIGSLEHFHLAKLKLHAHQTQLPILSTQILGNHWSLLFARSWLCR